MEEKEEGLSLGEIFHVMLIKKWLLLAITVVVMIIGVVFVHVFYNPGQEIYKMAFELEFPGVEEGRYPNGKKIVYSDFIRLKSLEFVKKYNTGFEDVDVTKMAERNDISIEEYIYYIQGEEIRTGKYTITVSKKYFSSSDQAKDFLVSLTEIPVDYAMAMGCEISYDTELELASVSGDYITQIDHLKEQKKLLLEGYNDLIDTYSNSISVDDVTLAQAKKNFIQFFDNNQIETLTTEVKNKGYVKKDSDFINSIKRKKTELLLEIEKNEAEIEALKELIKLIKDELGESAGSYYETISSITERMQELKTINSGNATKISQEYDKYINSAENVTDEELAEFDVIIQKYTKALEDFTAQYKNFKDSIYNNYSYVVYANASQIVSSGGISLLLVVIAFLVIGFVVGCCVNLVIDMPKYLRNKKHGNLALEGASLEKEEEIKE